MEPAVAFGRALRRLRKERGLTQEELGFEADLRRTFVSVLGLGQQQPTLTTIVKLAKSIRNETLGTLERGRIRKLIFLWGGAKSRARTFAGRNPSSRVLSKKLPI
jgi:transcriptional regulator with XRE-family HTH domain